MKIDPAFDGVIMLSQDEVYFSEANPRPDGQKVFHVYEWMPDDDAKSQNGEQKGLDQAKSENGEQKGLDLEMPNLLMGKALESSLDAIKEAMEANGIAFEEWCPPISPVKKIENPVESPESLIKDNSSDDMESDSNEEKESLVQNSGSHLIYVCNICKMSSKYVHSIRRHIKGVHSKESEVNDSYIDGFYSVCESPTEPTFYSCTVCKYKTLSKISLRKHQSTLRHFHEKESKEYWIPSLWKCTLCKFKADVKNVLIKHISELHEKSFWAGNSVENFIKVCFRCKICRDYFRDKGLAVEHLKSHGINVNGLNDKEENQGDSSNIRFNCHICSFECKLRRQLMSHIKRKHNDCDGDAKSTDSDKLFFCAKCPYTSKDMYEMNEHMTSLHNKGWRSTEGFECCNCNFRTVYRYSFERHMIALHSHTNTKYTVHACNICGFSTVDKTKLKNHMKFEHDESLILSSILKMTQLLNCDMCSYQSSSSSSLARHKALHLQNNLKCSKCDYNTYIQLDMDIHNKEHEEEENNELIEEAKRNAKTLRVNLNRFLIQNSIPEIVKIDHEFEDEVIVNCNGKRKRILLQGTKTLQNLKYITKHSSSLKPKNVSAENGSEKKNPLKCTYCPFLAKEKEGLWKHNSDLHSLFYIYKCNNCQFVGDSLHKLKVHERFHNYNAGEVAYKIRPKSLKCDHCMYMSNDKNLMKQHSLTHKEGQLLCSHCDFKTNNKSNLIHHLKLHRQ